MEVIVFFKCPLHRSGEKIEFIVFFIAPCTGQGAKQILGSCGMAEIIGYMATWTTYGTWLPGDERGYVDNKGQLHEGDEKILKENQERQKSPTVKLNEQEKVIARHVILDEAVRIGHKIIAIAVNSNHVHLLAKPHSQPIASIIGRYKSITTRAFWEYGKKGKIWTRGFDKRFCFTEMEIAARIIYIQKHYD
jgi:REP element-mobilizing transposase RayT